MKRKMVRQLFFLKLVECYSAPITLPLLRLSPASASPKGIPNKQHTLLHAYSKLPSNQGGIS